MTETERIIAQSISVYWKKGGAIKYIGKRERDIPVLFYRLGRCSALGLFMWIYGQPGSATVSNVVQADWK